LGKELRVGRDVMSKTFVISAILETGSYQSAYTSSPEEQIIRLQSMVAYLLGKNEQLRQFIAAQSEKG